MCSYKSRFVILLAIVALAQLLWIQGAAANPFNRHKEKQDNHNQNGKDTSGTEVRRVSFFRQHWKSIVILVVSLVILMGACFGTECFYVIKIYLKDRAPKFYTKMDTISNA